MNNFNLDELLKELPHEVKDRVSKKMQLINALEKHLQNPSISENHKNKIKETIAHISKTYRLSS
jgi:phage-related protein